MVKVDRTSTPPPSLAIEANKKSGSYREDDVLSLLAKDFHEKCYICEIKPVQDPQVEHRLPHHNRKIPARVFDWNNLYYSCSHCNSIKNSARYEEGIIDCCVRDPELLLKQQLVENHVKVDAIDKTDKEAVLTAELIEETFNSTSTGIRRIAGQERLKELQKTMNALITQMEKVRRNPSDKKSRRMLDALLSRSSKFAGFTRSYARECGWN